MPPGATEKFKSRQDAGRKAISRQDAKTERFLKFRGSVNIRRGKANPPLADEPFPSHRLFFLVARSQSFVTLNLLTLASLREILFRLSVNYLFARRTRRLSGRLIMKRHDEHRTFGPFQDSVGDASSEQMVKRPAPVRSQHN
jgi:hypothetical protein